MTEAVKRVYAFGKDANGNNVTEGNTEMKWVLGGKGANLAEMTKLGLPVPPGFTITTEACRAYLQGVDGPRVAVPPRSPSPCAAWRTRWAATSATPPTRCSSPCAAAPSSPCPA